ncbi:MAG: universal stress protein [Proteobacteria bacterium]|nr:universal stress protein [Pseudomonadota bacterium]
MAGKHAEASDDRAFLLVVDESEELHVALSFACRRAKSTGCRVALLYIMEPGGFHHWMAVEDLMEKEHRAEAEERLKELSAKVLEWTGSMPVLYIREGSVRDELLKLIDEEPSISGLILGAGTGPKGPGPLVTALGKMSGRLRVPLTIVPGSLDEEQIKRLI